jgi:mannose-6-phosphate isomerase-like protein (cupin superfamily)
LFQQRARAGNPLPGKTQAGLANPGRFVLAASSTPDRLLFNGAWPPFRPKQSCLRRLDAPLLRKGKVVLSKGQPVILHEGPCDERWDDERRGRVQWRTLFSAESTPTEGLTAGIIKIMAGNQLEVHRHAPPEVYYFLAGKGVLSVDGREYPVRRGTAVFIPGNADHGLRNTGTIPLRAFYTFPADSFSEVTYLFAG